MEDEVKVSDLATSVVNAWQSGRWLAEAAAGGVRADPEAKTLRISIDKAVSRLGWKPRWHFEEAVRRTIDWYQYFYKDPGVSMQDQSLGDIEEYEAAGAP